MAHFSLLQSADIAPTILVPTGFPCLLIKTQALSSNFTMVPSSLNLWVAALTTTPLDTSPALTLGAEEACSLVALLAFLTTHTISSPTLALVFPPMTLMHSTKVGPELSTT